MAPTTPVTPPAIVPVRRESVSKAVGALLDHLRKSAEQRKAQLLENDDFLYVVLTLRRIPASSRTNPYLLPLPHPLFASDASDDAAPSLCLFLDDRPHRGGRAPLLSPSDALDRARALSLPIAEAIGLSSIRADYRPYEARRRLCDSHDLFLADRAILHLLPRLIGKHFFSKKKIPLAVDLSRPGWPEQVRRCLSSAPLYLRTGTCCAVRVGRMSMDVESIVDNAMAVLEGAMGYIPKKWRNVRSVHVKAVDSVALPIYQTVPEMPLKIDTLPIQVEKKKDKTDAEGEVVNADDGENEKEEKKPNESSGRKRKKEVGKKQKGTRIHEVLPHIDEEKEGYPIGIGDKEVLGNEVIDEGLAIGDEEIMEEKSMKKKSTGKKEKVKKKSKKASA